MSPTQPPELTFGGHPVTGLEPSARPATCVAGRELYLEFREPGFAPAPLLEHLVTAGYLGRKTRRGFRECTRR